MRITATVLVFLLLALTQSYSQTTAQLKQALRGCEKDLNTSLNKIEQLENALKATTQISERRKALSDSLIRNLQNQIRLQAAINSSLKANADTLQAMVKDYDHKLNEVADLYRKELQKKARPWFLSWNGLQGFATGVLVGGALGVIFSIAR